MKPFFLLFCGAFLLLVTSSQLRAQPIEVVASGFAAIAGLSVDAQGNIWVAEGGTGNNDSRISVITPGGAVFPAVTGLPSLKDTATMETAGAWKAYRQGNNLQVLIGGLPLPDAGALLTFNLTNWTPGNAPLTIAQASASVSISDFVLANAFMESNPFRVTWDANGDAVIVDAAANSVLRHKASDGSFSILHTFAPIPNTFTPFPPFIDYVPTSIAPNPAGGFYVANLTGFPFVPGLAGIVKMDATGNVTPFVNGLTLIDDIEIDPATGDLFALQFGLFDTTVTPVFNSAKLLRITPSGTVTTVAQGFGPSPGFALDGHGGAYLAHLFTGQVLHVGAITATHQAAETPALPLTLAPNPTEGSSNIAFTLTEDADVRYVLENVAGQILQTTHLGFLPAGPHSLTVDLTSMPAGLYLVSIHSPEGNGITRVVKR